MGTIAFSHPETIASSGDNQDMNDTKRRVYFDHNATTYMRE